MSFEIREEKRFGSWTITENSFLSLFLNKQISLHLIILTSTLFGCRLNSGLTILPAELFETKNNWLK